MQDELDEGTYPSCVKISDGQMAALPVDRHEFHGDENPTAYHGHALEAWVLSHRCGIQLLTPGRGQRSEVEQCWERWQQCAASASPSVLAPVTRRAGRPETPFEMAGWVDGPVPLPPPAWGAVLPKTGPATSGAWRMTSVWFTTRMEALEQRREPVGRDAPSAVVRPLSRAAQRPCARPACPSPATATLAFEYAAQQVWVHALSEAAGPEAYDLCAKHASRTRAPQGWSLSDDRPPEEREVQAPSTPPDLGSERTVAVLAAVLRAVPDPPPAPTSFAASSSAETATGFEDETSPVLDPGQTTRAQAVVSQTRVAPPARTAAAGWPTGSPAPASDW